MTNPKQDELKLVDEATLQRSSIVANCTMNRERDLAGSNGYDRELGLDPVAWLINASKNKVANGKNGMAAGEATVKWLDLCCGTGRALIQAADLFAKQNPKFPVAITGLDLVDSFDLFHPPTPGSDSAEVSLEFVEASLATWQTGERFDLITCVHGLHYIGDKLGLIGRAARWLLPQGMLIANFDTLSVKLDDQPSSRDVSKLLRRHGCQYDARRRLLSIDGQRSISFPMQFLGASDRAGPNYTGQPAVDSYYRSMTAD